MAVWVETSNSACLIIASEKEEIGGDGSDSHPPEFLVIPVFGIQISAILLTSRERTSKLHVAYTNSSTESQLVVTPSRLQDESTS